MIRYYCESCNIYYRGDAMDECCPICNKKAFIECLCKDES